MADSKKLDLLTTDQVADYTQMSTSFFEKRRSNKTYTADQNPAVHHVRCGKMRMRAHDVQAMPKAFHLVLNFFGCHNLSKTMR